MSEHLFKFLLNEIAVVRVHCQNGACRGVVEIPIHKFGERFPDCACPLCHQQFSTAKYEDGNVLQDFSEAVQRMKAVKDRVQIEFVLPMPGTKS